MDAPAEWQRLVRSGLGVELRYPDPTPQGHPVERVEERVQDHRGDLERVHLSSPLSGELYVEVTRLRGVTPEDEYEQHRSYLDRRFGPGAVTELIEASLSGRPAWSYSFRGEELERSVLSLDLGGDTCRVIYDPRSELNAQVVATLAVVD